MNILPTEKDMIDCEVCGTKVHQVRRHLTLAHEGYSYDDYTTDYPGKPTLSPYATHLLKKAREEKASKEEEAIKVASVEKITVQSLSEAFGIKGQQALENGSEGYQMITVLNPVGEYADFIPEKDPNYVFVPEMLRNLVIGFELNIPVYVWGMAGVGKSSVLEQICAASNRPYLRVQHTANTEESHIVGQVLANEKGTYFEPGPLAIAMKHGLTYNADEYDYAHPSVCAIYQAVLEGKALVIKEAPHEWRIVKPHKNFRFVATGNTNGSGDETGLYSGTVMGNAANYSRFGVTVYVDYLKKAQEIKVLRQQTGITADVAEKLVEFAQSIRKSFKGGEITATIGQRELIYAARIGIARGEDWKDGLRLAYINRLCEVDSEIIGAISQRVFG